MPLPILLALLGALLLTMGGCKPDSGGLSASDTPAPPSHAGSPSTSSNDLFEQKQQRLSAINQLKTEIAAAEVGVGRQYVSLSERRKTLNTKDSAAVQAFNIAAAEYSKVNEDLAGKKAELNRLWKELEILTNESEARARQQSIQVVLYTTSWCPACRSAKAYMQQQGIAYVEKDVETSEQAAKEFSELGGGGVPLIVIKGHKMSGFSPEWVSQTLAAN